MQTIPLRTIKVKLSAKTEYALLAMVDLAEHFNKGLVKISDISYRKNIPKKFLEQILLTLKRTGYLKSRRGADGGYMLLKPPDSITVAEVIRLMDGALAPVESVSSYFYDHTPIEQDERLIALFKDIRDYISNKLEKTTFSDIIRQ